MGIIDWLADKIQTSTGEKERRELVQIVKDLADEFKEKVSQAIVSLNRKLNEFNQKIIQLNEFRSRHVKKILNNCIHFFQNMETVDHIKRTLPRLVSCRRSFRKEKWLKSMITLQKSIGQRKMSFEIPFG